MTFLALIQPTGRALLLTGSISAMLLLAGHSPAGAETTRSYGSGHAVERASGEWAAGAGPLQSMPAIIEQDVAVQRWVF